MSVQLLSNDVLPTAVVRHGAYICVRPHDRVAIASAAVDALAHRRGFAHEFDADDGHPEHAFALLGRVEADAGDIADEALQTAVAIVHVASPSPEQVDRFCAEVVQLVASSADTTILQGVVRPPSFTGGAMHNFAYAHQLTQRRGSEMPHAFLLPMRKTADWWAKSWMERHTYFLPRYDSDRISGGAGRMISEGHPLAAAPGIPHLMRRTYKHPTEPAPEGGYDFITYFECADEGVPIFHSVCAALRDVDRNPEWRYVREGPTWHGRRVRTWAELFALPRASGEHGEERN